MGWYRSFSLSFPSCFHCTRQRS